MFKVSGSIFNKSEMENATPPPHLEPFFQTVIRILVYELIVNNIIHVLPREWSHKL